MKYLRDIVFFIVHKLQSNYFKNLLFLFRFSDRIVYHQKMEADDSLQTHLKTIHEGKRNLRCNLCEKQLTTKNSLNMHIKTSHVGEKKNYECEKCNKKFRNSSHLKAHFESIHLGKKYKCITCEKEFSCKCNLKQHFSTSHGNNTDLSVTHVKRS